MYKHTHPRTHTRHGEKLMGVDGVKQIIFVSRHCQIQFSQRGKSFFVRTSKIKIISLESCQESWRVICKKYGMIIDGNTFMYTAFYTSIKKYHNVINVPFLKKQNKTWYYHGTKPFQYYVTFCYCSISVCIIFQSKKCMKMSLFLCLSAEVAVC